MNREVEYWDNAISAMKPNPPEYDLWLDKYQDILSRCGDVPIIDLGCGWGSDTLYLAERGYRVIACDFSDEALLRVNQYVPEAVTKKVDFLSGLPFDNGSAKVIVADLCLHYFLWADTCRILDDIKRVLADDGVLLCRVNSTLDICHGAGQGVEIEKNYYDNGVNFKRFFNREQVCELFVSLNIIHMDEWVILKYAQPKTAWEIAAVKAGILPAA